MKDEGGRMKDEGAHTKIKRHNEAKIKAQVSQPFFHPSAFILPTYLMTPRFEVSMKRTSSSTSVTFTISFLIRSRAWVVFSLEDSSK